MEKSVEVSHIELRTQNSTINIKREDCNKLVIMTVIRIADIFFCFAVNFFC